MKVSVDIVLTQYSVYVWEPIEDFPCDLGVRDNALIPIVLQGARGKEQPIANLPSCEVDFTFKKRTMSLSYASHSIRQTFNAREAAKRTFREFSKNFPALENKISKGGKINFQGRKRSFPTLESFFSNAGKLQFHGKEVVKLP